MKALRATLDVAGEVTEGGGAPADVLKLDVPGRLRAEGLVCFFRKCFVNVWVLSL